MDRRSSAPASAQKRRRRITLIWIAAVAAGVIGLIWAEQIALLYVLATLGVTALLVVVALADLSGSRRSSNESSAYDAAAIADGVMANAGAPAASAKSRATRRRQ